MSDFKYGMTVVECEKCDKKITINPDSEEQADRFDGSGDVLCDECWYRRKANEAKQMNLGQSRKRGTEGSSTQYDASPKKAATSNLQDLDDIALWEDAPIDVSSQQRNDEHKIRKDQRAINSTPKLTDHAIDLAVELASRDKVALRTGPKRNLDPEVAKAYPIIKHTLKGTEYERWGELFGDENFHPPEEVMQLSRREIFDRELQELPNRINPRNMNQDTVRDDLVQWSRSAGTAPKDQGTFSWMFKHIEELQAAEETATNNADADDDVTKMDMS